VEVVAKGVGKVVEEAVRAKEVTEEGSWVAVAVERDTQPVVQHGNFERLESLRWKAVDST